MKEDTKRRAELHRSKSELVAENDEMDLEPTGKYVKENPYKTPPNKFTTKSK